MIETVKLSKHFGSIKAVDNLSFKVDRGEVLGFLGPNGAGKSTTMKMLTCFLTPSGGTAKVCGHDILENPMDVKRSVGYLPETAPAYGEMAVAAFLGFIAEIRGFSGDGRRKAVDRAIDECFLSGVRNQTIETLSKGYKRRVGLAQALLHDPPVLIMDEPTDGLDPNQKHEVRALIQRMAKDKVIVLSTHILEEVEAVCTRAIVVARGRLAADGTPEELKRKSRFHGAVTALVAAKSAEEVKDAIGKVEGVATVEILEGAPEGHVRVRAFPVSGKEIAAEIGTLLRDRKWTAADFHVEQGHLDEVFRTLTENAEDERRRARAAAVARDDAARAEDDEDEDEEDEDEEEDDDEADEDRAEAEDDESSEEASGEEDDAGEDDEEESAAEVLMKAGETEASAKETVEANRAAVKEAAPAAKAAEPPAAKNAGSASPEKKPASGGPAGAGKSGNRSRGKGRKR